MQQRETWLLKSWFCKWKCSATGDLWTQCYVSACWRLTSGHLRIVSEGWAGSSENTMKLHSIDGLTQVGYAKQRPTVLVGAVCDYLDSFTLPVNSVSFFLFSPLLLLETVGKHCPIGPSNSSIPCWKQLTW